MVLLRILAVTLLILTCAGCGTDNRERIALATLYTDDAPASQNDVPSGPASVLAGALNEKFPPGTDLEPLKRYVAQFDGACDQSQPGQPEHCRFIEMASVCIQTEVSITAKTNRLNKIEHVDAKRLSTGC